MADKVRSPFDTVLPADAPPKFSEVPPEAPKPSGLPRATPLKAKLVGVYATIGTGVFYFDQYCGTAILESAEATAEAMDNLAKENASVRRVLEALVKTSALGTVIAAHMPIVMAIAAHHGPDNVREMVTGLAGAAQTKEAA